MKKLAILAVLACMVFGFAASASAVDLDAKGQFQFQMNFMDNPDFLSNKDGGTNEDDLNFWFRARTEFRFIANENLWAVLYTEYKNRVGNGHTNEQSGDTGLYVKRAYMQYRYPGTEVLTSAGIMSINLPGAVTGSMVLGDADRGAFMVETPITDEIAIAGAFIRYTDTLENDPTDATSKDELDIFYAAMPITLDGISATPYFAYAVIGEDTNTLGNNANFMAPTSVAMTKNANAWWLGTSFNMDMFDPIVFAADAVYGSVDGDVKQNDRSGFLFDASVAYTGLDFVQPVLKFAYTTGEDDKTSNGSERLPIVAEDFDLGTYYLGASGLTETDLGKNPIGFWALGLSFDNISFFEKLTHKLAFTYIQGTNDKDLIKNAGAGVTNANITADGNFLTTEDHVFAIDFNTNYQIYDELAAIVEFGYADVDLDKGTWENYGVGNGFLNTKQDPNFKLALGLVYKF